MKKVFYATIVSGAFFLTSCGADQATVDKMAGELCTALDGVSLDDPMSLMKAAGAMQEISEKESEYNSVTEDQLMGALKEQCPEGHETFTGLLEMGK